MIPLVINESPVVVFLSLFSSSFPGIFDEYHLPRGGSPDQQKWKSGIQDDLTQDFSKIMEQVHIPWGHRFCASCFGWEDKLPFSVWIGDDELVRFFFFRFINHPMW